MTNFFTRDEVVQFGDVVWNESLTQWNPTKSDVYSHFVAVMKADGDNTYRAFKRHQDGMFELVSGERSFDDAVSVLMTTYSDSAA